MGKYIIEVDESEIVECWNEQATKELGYQEYALKHCPKIKVKPYNPTGDLISREALKDEVRKHAEYYADRTEEDRYNVGYTECACEVLDFIDNAQAVEITEEQAIDKLHETGWLIGHDKEMTTRPQGEWIIDGHHRRCKKCGEYFCIADSEGNEIPSNFCPNCGAEMKGGAENG